MTIETSCGAVVYTRAGGEIRYLLIRSPEGWWGFPKGHMEPGETEEQTALREIREEVGLRVTLRPGFRTSDEHPIPSRPEVIKRIAYFCADCGDRQPTPQPGEVAAIALAPLEKALALFQFESSRRILREADAFLRA